MKLKSLLQMLAAALVLALAPSLAASEMVVGNVRVIKVTGSSAKLVSVAGKTTPLQEGMFIQQGFKILTGGDSSVSLVFENGSSVEVEPSSSFSIDEFVQDPFSSENLDYKTIDKAPSRSVTKISVPQGSIIFNVAKQKPGSTYDIVTPVGVAGIRGTAGFAGSGGFGLTTGSASFSPPGGTPINFRAGQYFSPGTGMGSIPPGLQQSINSATQTLNSNTPPNTFNSAPPNLTPQQFSAIQSAAAQGGEALAQTASQLAATAPQSAADIAAVAAYFAPAVAPQIAAAVAQTVPTAAADVTLTVSKVLPPQAQMVAEAVMAAVPSADPAAVQQAAQQGAQQGSGQQQQEQGNQPLTTGDQGTITAGQQLPGTGSGTSGNPAPRPTPASQ